MLKLSRKEAMRAIRAHAAGRPHHVPVRKVITKSTARILRELASVKMGCAVPCESRIEFDHYTVLDVRRDVTAFYAQPEVARYMAADGRWRNHVPDVLVHHVCGRVEYHDVKPDDVADDPGFRAMHDSIAAHYAERGLVHLVAREGDIRRQPRLRNALLLRSKRVHRVEPDVLEAARDMLRDGPLPLASLVGHLRQGARGNALILALVLRGLLCMDWETVAIGPDSSVSLPRQVTP